MTPHTAAVPMIDFEPADAIGRRVLFTPGPVTCSRAVLDAAAADIGAWDDDAFSVATECRRAIAAIAGSHDDIEVTLLPGSGTYAVEATIGSFVPRGAQLLILSNGLYGQRLVGIAKALDIDHAVLTQDERNTFNPDEIDAFLARHPRATHVAVCHCETTTGVLNDLNTIGPIVERHDKRLIVDAVATFAGYTVGPGADIDIDAAAIDHLVTSSNKCFQGMPGIGVIVSRAEALHAGAGVARSMSLDVPAQWESMASRKRFRFTAPTHVLLALRQALRELEEETLDARIERYRANHATAVKLMGDIGFNPYIDASIRSHINTTFTIDSDFPFADLVAGVRAKGFVLFPQQVTAAPTLRIGAIGAVGPAEVAALIDAIAQTINEPGPAAGAAT